MSLFVYKSIATALVCFFVALPIIFASDSVNTEYLDRNGKVPYATYNSCGGYVESVCDQTIVLEYKPNEQYDNNEFCVWVIRNRECMGSVITKMESGFEAGYDYIQISGFEDTEIGSGPSYTSKWGSTTNWEQVSIRSYVNFLVFTTDNSNTGTGFRVEIVGWWPLSNPRWSDDFISTSTVGTTELRPYFQNMMQSWLIVPKPGSVPSLVMNVEYNMPPTSAYLSVYTMERNGQSINFRPQARVLRGNGTATFEAAYYTNYVVLFYSYVRETIPDYAGVTFNWYPAEYVTN